MKRLAALSLLALATLAGGWLLERRVAADTLDLGSSLLLLGVAWLGLCLLVELLLSGLHARPELRSGLRVALFSGGVLLVGSELFLRFGWRVYETYLERNGASSYQAVVGYKTSTWFLAYDPQKDERWTMAEYVHVRRSNSMGLHERELPVAKPPGEYRILALGDSFTEGLGAEQQETWVAVMQRELRERLPGRAIEAINAGVSGSDTCFEYVLLRDRLVAYEPDLVLVALNTTDVQDVALRGGMERFRPDGLLQPRRGAPSWEWLYGLSYVVRHVVHDVLGYNHFLVPEDQWDSALHQALGPIREAIRALAALGREHGFRTVVVFHAMDDRELVRGRYHFGLGELLGEFARSDSPVRVIDTLEYSRRHGVMFGNDAPRFFWPIDGHLKAEGYAVLGRAVAEGLLALPTGLEAPATAAPQGPTT